MSTTQFALPDQYQGPLGELIENTKEKCVFAPVSVIVHSKAKDPLFVVFYKANSQWVATTNPWR